MKRAWNRFRAWLGGYFWLPCPLCGRMFGGHEVHGGTLLMTMEERVSTGTLVCINCGDEANRRNAERFGIRFAGMDMSK